MKVYSQRITFFNLLTYNVETNQSLYLARPQCDMNNSYCSLTKVCMKLISYFQNDLQAGWKHLMWHWYHILTQDTKCLQYCKFILVLVLFSTFPSELNLLAYKTMKLINHYILPDHNLTPITVFNNETPYT